MISSTRLAISNPHDLPSSKGEFEHELLIEVFESALDASKLSWDGILRCANECMDGIENGRHVERADIFLFVFAGVSDRICQQKDRLGAEMHLHNIIAAIETLTRAIDIELVHHCDPVDYATRMLMFSDPEACCGSYEAIELLEDCAKTSFPHHFEVQVKPKIQAYRTRQLELVAESEGIKHLSSH